MAVQGSQDLKIFSSVRPLQIQRSFEGPPEATDIESVTRNVTFEKRSSVTITSQTSSSGMSTVHTVSDGVPTSPSSVAAGTVIIRSSSSTTSQTSPGTVRILSSGTAPITGEASTSPGVGAQNVVILRSPSAVAQTGPAPQLVSSGQGTIVIKSATTPPVVTTTAIQPNAQSRIIINPSPITQSRFTITGGGATPVVQQTPPQTETTETQVSQAPPPQARRSSLTIKTAPSPTSPTAPVEVATLVNSSQPQAAPVISDGAPPSHYTPAEHVPHEAVVTEQHHTPELATHPSTVTAKEDLSEKIHQKKPAGPTLEEILEKFDISKVFYTALAVLVTCVICILTEGEVPLSWLLAAISVISLGSFIALRL